MSWRKKEKWISFNDDANRIINIPPKHVNAKGSVGGRKRSGYHVMMMQTKNIPPKHVNTKGSVGGRKRSGYHVMIMQTKNIPSKHVNAKGSVGGRKRSGYHVMMMNIQTYPLNMSMPRVHLEKEREVDII